MTERDRAFGAKRGWAAALAATAVVAVLGGVQAGASTTGSTPQVISFTSAAPTGALVHGQPYAVTATGGGSGNAVVFSSATPSVCVVVGPTVDFVSAGTCTVDANQAGNAEYLPAATASQSFAVVDGPDAIVSPDHATATVGSRFLFFVEATGVPDPSIRTKGRFPVGLTAASQSEGFLTISGVVPADVYSKPTGGVYQSTIVATFLNGSKHEKVVQPFSLTVDESPGITSETVKIAHAGQAYDSFIKTTGFPAPTVSESGRLPAGLVLSNNGSNGASLSGSPNLFTAGTYPITLTASNGVGSPSVRHVVLLVTRP